VRLRIGLLQLNSTVGDFAANAGKLLAAHAQAARDGAEFVLAPELFLCGYPPRDLLQREDFVEANLKALAEVAAEIGPVPLCLGYVERNPDRPGRALRNAAAVLQRGRVIWRTAKSLLPTYDVFDEDRYFEPAAKVEPFAFNGRKLGITICEDIWNDEDFWPTRLYRRDPVRELIGQGAEMILAVFDCGILVSGIGWPGNPRACLILVAHRQVRLCVTSEVWSEYDARVPEILAQKRPGINPRPMLDWLLTVAHFVEATPLGKPRSRDIKDDRYLACALAAGAALAGFLILWSLLRHEPTQARALAPSAPAPVTAADWLPAPSTATRPK